MRPERNPDPESPDGRAPCARTSDNSDESQRTEWFERRCKELPPAARKQIQGCRGARGRTQKGFGLIDAMVAVVIFGFGMAALAALYVRMAPQPYQNLAVAQVQMAANSLIGDLTANTSLLPLNTAGISQSSGMPSGLQGWFTQASQGLPGFTVISITSGPTASGQTCSATACGVTFTLSWTQMGVTRTQTFTAQIGVS